MWNPAIQRRKKVLLYSTEWFYTSDLWTQKYLFPSVDSTHVGLIAVYSAYVYIQTEETNLSYTAWQVHAGFRDMETTQTEYANLYKEAYKFMRFKKELLATH